MSKTTKLTAPVPAGETTGNPAPTKGQELRFIGFPVDGKGQVKHTTMRIGFDGTFDGQKWSTINDANGAPLTIQARPAQLIQAPADSFNPNWQGLALIPVPVAFDPILTGWEFIRIRLEKPEKERLEVEFYVTA